ncbi:hypothetical protein BSPWISOXPB_4740 [uncultured Gammaproteobacteria bacterium]|nr:hypothetical protein BSPWISOXPB_4740 [uncultured Gammaproteobacteria bacterium]
MKAGFNKLIAHGLTGGVRSRLSGGSFKSGFLGSAVSYGASWSGAYEAAGVSSQANTWAQRVQNAVASYVVGGIAAELGGGKFANGGMSAAFSRMFNDLSSAYECMGRCHGNDYGKILKTNNIVNGNIGGSGSLFLGVFGVSGFIGKGGDSNGNRCFVGTGCMQFGLGVFGGAGASIEGGYSKPLTTGSSQSWGFFLMAGAVLLVEQMLILTRAELVEAKDLLEVVLALQEAFNFVKVMLIVIIK